LASPSGWPEDRRHGSRRDVPAARSCRHHRALVGASPVRGTGTARSKMRRPLVVEGLLRTLEDLAGIGDKRAGSPGVHRAAAYLYDRLQSVGLPPRLESFHFPRHEVTSSTLELTLNGQMRPFACEVLEASGAGRLRGRVLDLGNAIQVSGPLRGAVALVDRD